MVGKGVEKWGQRDCCCVEEEKLVCLFVCLFAWSDVAVMMLQQVCVCSAVFFAVFLCVCQRERERERKGGRVLFPEWHDLMMMMMMMMMQDLMLVCLFVCLFVCEQVLCVCHHSWIWDHREASKQASDVVMCVCGF